MTEQQWQALKDRLPVGTRVRGVVARVAPFGVFVTLAHTENCLLPVTHFEDGPRVFQLSDYPAVGSEIEVVVVAHADHNQQIRLSARASDRN